MSTGQQERRRMPRCALQEPVTIKFWDHGPREITGMVHNASPDGVFLQSEREIPQHSRVELVFLFPATLRSPGVRFVCQCRIVRRVQQNQAGRHGLALAIVRTESERLSAQPVQEGNAWQSPDLVLAES